MCGPCVVVCGDFAFFKVPPCVGSVLWCVGTLRFSKFPCVCGDFEFFNVPLCVCGPCVVVCGDFAFFKQPCV